MTLALAGCGNPENPEPPPRVSREGGYLRVVNLTDAALQVKIGHQLNPTTIHPGNGTVFARFRAGKQPVTLGVATSPTRFDVECVADRYRSVVLHGSASKPQHAMVVQKRALSEAGPTLEIHRVAGATGSVELVQAGARTPLEEASPSLSAGSGRIVVRLASGKEAVLEADFAADGIYSLFISPARAALLRDNETMQAVGEAGSR